ncbi:MAG: chemotaxis-specific protein-glutamate methyltransferase CheB, partial [Spirochaetales bacterium]|nr:chemotaxis-specific protein-glutamate methyltransferase CheB [Spirochaetales bacterium]
LTLDIEMPRMDGLTFLKYLMKYFPIPVVVVSSLTDGKNAASLDALELGAVDIVPKPGGAYSVADILETLKEKILIAASVDFSKIKVQAQKNREIVLKAPKRLLSQIATTNKLIAVGASTGGTIALESLFKGFTPDFPPTVCVIHMPERFTTTFAQRLDSISRVNVVEAADGMMLVPATVYLAPGNFHLMVRARGKDFFLRVVSGPKVHHQRPAVDVLFQSVAAEAGRNAVGVLLTGMGRDGAEGLLKIKTAGGTTIAQDEASCIVFGMPKEAIALGAADKILPLEQIAEAVHQAVKN